MPEKPIRYSKNIGVVPIPGPDGVTYRRLCDSHFIVRVLAGQHLVANCAAAREDETCEDCDAGLRHAGEPLPEEERRA